MSDEEKSTPLTPDIKFQLVRRMERHKVIGLAGPVLLEHEAKYLEFHRLSGVILFERNIESIGQVRDLIGSVEERLGVEGVSPLIMVDHEGDFVSDLHELIGIPPSAMAVAATGDTDLAREVAFETGQAMRKLGVNTVLAPVADCYTDPASPVTGLRTFGADPERVGEFVTAVVEGFASADVLTCAKHFPGHGASDLDSHVDLPEVRKDLDALRRAELVPFACAVRAGVDIVMTAHVAYSFDKASDAMTPASFDGRLIRGVLREELGFDGVVMTDALEMEGARRHTRSKYGGLTGGFERALLAGSDLLLYSASVPEKMRMQSDGEPMIAVEVMHTIISTLDRVADRSRIDSKLEEAAEQHEGVRNLLRILDASQRRVRRLRDHAGGLRPAQPRKPQGNVISLQSYASTPPIYKKVAERSLIVLRDPESFIPVDAAEQWLLIPIRYGDSPFLKGQNLPEFMEGLLRHFPKWRVGPAVIGFDEDDSGGVRPVFAAPERKVVVDAALATGTSQRQTVSSDAPVVPIFSARGVPPDDYLSRLADFVDQQQAPFVIVTGWPVVDWVPEGTGCMLTLGASSHVGVAVGALLRGELEATGALDRPV